MLSRRYFKLFMGLLMMLWVGVAVAQAPLTGLSGDLSASSSAPLKIAALSYLGDEATTNEWQATVQWLRESLPQYDFEFIPAAQNEIIDMVRNEQVDYVLTNPGLYSQLHYEYGINHMLSQVYATDTLSAFSLGSVLIKRIDNQEIQGFDDLLGRSIAIVSREAFGGYQVMLRELRKRQINPEVQMQLKQVGFPMGNVLDAVASGEVDTGVIRACVLEAISGWDETFSVVEAAENTDFPCLVTTRLYPGWVFAAIKNERLVETRDIMLSLLQLPPYETRGGEMHWSALSNTQSLYDLFKELEIDVYGAQSPTLWVYFERYWWMLAMIVFLFACGGLYTGRVRYLVSKRTEDLEFALEQQKALQNRINDVQEQANHQTKLAILGEMSGTFAHELNQPLATIGNYSRSVLRRLKNDRLNPEDVRLAAAEIVEQTERASSIIQGVRAFARKRPMQPERVSIKTVCEEAVQLFTGMLSLPPQVLIFDFLGKVKILAVDPVQIQQALINLLKNGYDSMSESHESIAIIHLILWRSANQIHITVQDSGQGLSEAAKANLFETFYTSKKDGLGLGLSVCRTIAEAHGGKLELDVLPSSFSIKPLSGATFTLSLPLP